MIAKIAKRLLFTSQLPEFSYVPPEYTGKSKSEILKIRSECVNPALFLYYSDPLMLVDGKMQYVFDELGNRYLDLFAGIVTVSVGHCHPTVIAAAKEQLDKIQHTTTIYAHPGISEYAEKLVSKFPDHLDTVFFTNSGSESTDVALLLARLATGNTDLICLRNCYHGMSAGAMGITSLSTWKYPVPQGLGIQRVLTPNTYTGPFADLPEAEQTEKYLWDLENCIQHTTCGSVAGMICEPIQGVGGAVKMPKGYLKKAFEMVRGYGGVAIADEVQTGFGRLGTHYWGFEEADAKPDIVTLAKGIGNGHPMGAVVTTREIGEKLAQKLFFNTFGGNPLAMAIGSAVLDVMDEEDCQGNSLARGNQFLDGFNKMKEKYEIIGDVRGQGLMLGVELVKDRETKAPATEETVAIFEMLKDMGVLVGKGGIAGNVFRIKPPMCITEEDVAYALECFDECFNKL